MVWLLIFIAGLVIGAILGVGAMCLFYYSSSDREVKVIEKKAESGSSKEDINSDK